MAGEGVGVGPGEGRPGSHGLCVFGWLRSVQRNLLAECGATRLQLPPSMAQSHRNSPLRRFAERLVMALRDVEIPTTVRTERDLEQRVIIPTAQAVQRTEPKVHIFVHPFKNRRRCMPDCEAAHSDRGTIEIGCPQCWHDSKPSWSVAAFGTHHTFDLVALAGAERLALEAKLVSARGKRMPNGEIQRFVGQCALAVSKHDIVIGVCVHRGAFNPKWHADTARVQDWARALGLHLLFREIPSI